MTPKKQLWRGRSANLGWVVGQLVWHDNVMFIVNNDCYAGWCWFAVDEVEHISVDPPAGDVP